MPSKKHKAEEIIAKLREVEIVLAQGASTAKACCGIAKKEAAPTRASSGMAAPKRRARSRARPLRGSPTGLSRRRHAIVTGWPGSRREPGLAGRRRRAISPRRCRELERGRAAGAGRPNARFTCEALGRISDPAEAIPCRHTNTDGLTMRLQSALSSLVYQLEGRFRVDEVDFHLACRKTSFPASSSDGPATWDTSNWPRKVALRPASVIFANRPSYKSNYRHSAAFPSEFIARTSGGKLTFPLLIVFAGTRDTIRRPSDEPRVRGAGRANVTKPSA